MAASVPDYLFCSVAGNTVLMRHTTEDAHFSRVLNGTVWLQEIVWMVVALLAAGIVEAGAMEVTRAEWLANGDQAILLGGEVQTRLCWIGGGCAKCCGARLWVECKCWPRGRRARCLA
jgi:hypothetical protein